jgi:nucleoside-diphosphate-sugar epimerase
MSNLERVAILGGSGWVGRTASNWLAELDTHLLLMASNSRPEKVGNRIFQVHAYDFERIKSFKPTAVIDAAFITRERVGQLSLDTYTSLNTQLIDQALAVQRLPTVEKFIGVSSGAAVPHLNPESPGFLNDPYGSLKATYEKRLLGETELRDKTTIARIWSVSGDLVTKPNLFAFSNLIQQAMSGSVEIQSKHQVWRRYVDLEDFIKVVSLAEPEESRVIDSGGKLIEIQELAETIFTVLGVPPSILRDFMPGRDDDHYYSAEATWLRAVHEIGYVPKTLEQQITKVASGLRG